MKTVNKISLWVLCAVLFMLSGCAKNHTPAEEEQRQVIGFDAQSEATPVKATTPFSDFHNDFGVWGIARHTGKPDYILWETNAMSKVEKKGSENVYVPVEDAYWVAGYKYNFIAVAPWEAAEDISSVTAGNSSGEEKLYFTYSLADKYEKNIFDFDLMASVAANEVGPTASTHKSQQPLIFWHLFSKICISVNFMNVTGTVNAIRLYNVDTDCNYTVSTGSSNQLNVLPTSPNPTQANQAIVSLGRDDLDKNTDSQWTVHIHPQDISDFILYLDFALTEGSQTVSVTNFEVDLTNAKAAPDYGSNESYNWKIKITPKAVAFDVSVTDWDGDVNGDGDVDSDDEFEFELQ